MLTEVNIINNNEKRGYVILKKIDCNFLCQKIDIQNPNIQIVKKETIMS